MADYLSLIRSETMGLEMLKMYVNDDEEEMTDETRGYILSKLLLNERMRAIVWMAGREMWLQWTGGTDVYADIWGGVAKKPQLQYLLYWTKRMWRD
jgi:hypothetical protein